MNGVEFSREDLKQKVTLPSLSDPLLSYETGVHIGDGSLQLVSGGTHSVRFFGHSEEDWEFFSEYLPMAIKHLYNKDVQPTKRKDAKTCTLSICSKAVATFKSNVLGLPAGNKIQLKGLPDFVKVNEMLLKYCIRGIGDTDFGLYFHKDHRGVYSEPTLNCTMANEYIIRDLAFHLEKLGFRVKSKFKIPRERNGKLNFEHKLDIYGKDQLIRWMEVIGFSNSHYTNKFLFWKKFGFCNPKPAK